MLESKRGFTMWGLLGFTAASLAFILYGYSAYELAGTGKKFNRDHYFIGYALASAGCLAWASGTIWSGHLMVWVLLGDLLLLAASAFLLNTVFPRKMNLAYFLVAGAALFSILAVRIKTAADDPFMRGSVLVFNTPRAFGFILGVILLLVWIRSNMNFYEKVVDTKFPLIFRPVYFSANIVGFVSVVAFLMARKDLTIISAFSILIVSFLFMAFMNRYIQKLPAKSLGKAAAHAK